MDPKKKKLYIVVIVACLVLSIGVLYFGGVLGGGSGEDLAANSPESLDVNPAVVNIPTNVAASGGGDALPSNYGAPLVFPATENFATDVLESEAYKRLKPYDPVSSEGLLGRPDPFRNY